MAISRKRKVVIISVVVVVMAAVLTASLMAGNREAPEVNTGKVKKVSLLESKVTASGEVRPVKFYNLTAEVSGRITKIEVREGDSVKKGAALIRVDPTQLTEQVIGSRANVNAAVADVGSSYSQVNTAQNQVAQAENNVYSAQANLASAEADLERARTDFVLAEADYKRNQQLLESGVIARSTFEQFESRLNSSKSSVNAAQQRVNQLKTQVKDSQIRVQEAKLRVKTAEAGLNASQARVRQVESNVRSNEDLLGKTTKFSPIDGVVSSLPVKEGEYALANLSSTPLMIIADMSEVNVEVKVDETDIANVRTGQTAKVKIDALGEQEIDGQVTEVGSSAITRSGQTISSSTTSQEAKDFKVVVKLLPDDATREKLRPGMSATAVVTTEQRKEVLVVPLQALVLQDAEDGNANANIASEATPVEKTDKPKEIQGVFLLEGDRVKFTPVKTGITGDIDIMVESGLEEGQEIVTGPFSVLRTLKNDTLVKRAPAGSERGGKNPKDEKK